MYSTVKNIKVNGETYTFVCSFRSTRNGFAHDCELFKNTSCRVNKASCHYINRTWENYEYRSVMQRVVSEAIHAYEQASEQQFRREHNITRLTAKRRAELEAFTAAQRANNTTWRELIGLYDLI